MSLRCGGVCVRWMCVSVLQYIHMRGVSKKNAQETKEKPCNPQGVVMALKMVLIIVLVVFISTAAWGIIQYTHAAREDGTISFSGVGEITVTNTVGSVSFTFSDVDEDVTQARDVVSKKTNEVYLILRNTFTIKEKDIQTTSYTIYPEYEYIRPIQGGLGKNELVGYRVSHTTAIKIRDLDQISAIIDAVSALSPTSMSGLRFTVDDDRQKQLEEQALIAAIKDAKEKARRVSKKSGIKLKDVVSIDMHDYPGVMQRSYQAEAFVQATKSASSAPPVAEGESRITKSVTIVYTLGE